MRTLTNRARDTLLLVLILATVGGSIYAGFGTSNYYQFYPALTKLQLNLTDLQWNSTDTSLNGTAVFTLENPTSYHGLLLRVFQPKLGVQINNTETITQGPITSRT